MNQLVVVCFTEEAYVADAPLRLFEVVAFHGPRDFFEYGVHDFGDAASQDGFQGKMLVGTARLLIIALEAFQ